MHVKKLPRKGKCPDAGPARGRSRHLPGAGAVYDAGLSWHTGRAVVVADFPVPGAHRQGLIHTAVFVRDGLSDSAAA